MILIMDDDPEIAECLKQVIKDFYQEDVVLALSDQGAEFFLRTQRIKAAFLDYSFRKRKFSCEQIATIAKEHDTKTILFSGDVGIDNIEGFDFYLPKPSKREAIKQIIDRVLNKN